MALAQAQVRGVSPSSPPAVASSFLMVGELLAQRYQVEEHISHGGMGVVFRGRDLQADGPVAIKVLRADRHHEQLLARFRHEYYLMATLSHPRFVQVRDLVMTRAGLPCLVMEYLPGADLDRSLPLSLSEGVEVLDQLCEALAFLHSRRYVHHDLKSNNVRVERDADGKIQARLIDFGIMESVGSVRRELAGTPAYLPPEVLYGAPADPRLDLYSLGVLAFEVLAGYIPFDIRDAESFIQAKQVSAPDVKRLLHELPEPLAELIADLMSPDPAARPHDAQVVRRRLRVFSPHLGAATALAAPPYLTPSRLFGRDAELESLLRAWEESAASPRLCGVRAPGGLGKSALLRELALQVRLRGGVAELFSVDPGAGAFSALRPLLRSLWRADGGDVPELRALAPQVMRVLPELGSLNDDLRPAAPHPDPAEDRRQLYRAVCEWVGRLKGERPLAVLVDDAHLADGASLEALRALHVEPSLGGLYIVVAAAEDAGQREVALGRLLAGAEVELRLTPLCQRSVAELLTSLFGTVEPYPKLTSDLTQGARGNPALVLEILRELVQRQVIQYADERWHLPRVLGDFPVPASLAEALDARLETLDADARQVMGVLVIGRRRLPFATIVSASGLSEPRVFRALNQLRDADLISPSADGYDLVPGLSRARLEERLPEPERRALHAALGRILERDYGAEAPAHAAELADHFLVGGAYFKARRYLDIAGRELYEAQALLDARPLLEQLERLLIAEGAEEEPYASEAYQQLLATRQRLARLGVAADSNLGCAMLELERRMFLPEVRALRSRAPMGSRVLELTRVLTRGLRHRRAPLHTLQARLFGYFSATTYHSVLLAMKGEFGQSADVAHTLLPFILTPNDISRGAYAICRSIVLTHQGLVKRAEHFGRLALKLYDEADARGDTQLNAADYEAGRAGVHTLMALLFAERGAPQATEWLDRFQRYTASQEVDRAWLVPNLLLVRLQYHLHRGEVTRVREVEVEYKAAHARAGGFNAHIELKILVSLARAALAARDVVAAEALCGEILRYPEEEASARAWGSVVLGEAWRQQRLFERARRSLDQALALAVRPSSRAYKLEMRARNARAALALDVGDLVGAQLEASAALSIACDPETRSEYEELWARRVLVFTHHEAGREEEARRELAALAALTRVANNPLFEAVYQRLIGEGIGVQGALSGEHRAQAERLFERLGYTPDTLGGSRRGITGEGAWWSQVTVQGVAPRDPETQHEVAHVAPQGEEGE